MKILGIETATSVCAAAIVEDGRVVSERSVEGRQIHSEKLLPLIDEAFIAARMNVNELDGIAVSIGPGSFTGLRIGLSAAKGLAFASGKPLIAVSTLEALALQATRVKQNIKSVLAILDSRKGECFAALYRVSGGNIDTIIAPAAWTHAEITHALAAHRDDIIDSVMTGEGAEKFLAALKNISPEVFTIISEQSVILSLHERVCSAAAVALLGVERLKRGLTADLAELEPEYLKEFFTTATILQVS